ncbi:hypothetical protein [Nonomuraea sp. NPDC005650]|uniref:hypothetical protein n=1 Tax=Nonomuraea sp. NPDC005650 TaxID=3157045 RepID=UPI0033B55723
MRITAALTGGLLAAAAVLIAIAPAASAAAGPSVVTGEQCLRGGGQIRRIEEGGRRYCHGGTYDGHAIG